MKLAKMTCDQPGGRVAVSEVKGFISFAGKTGVRGRVVSREGSLVSQALIAGIVGGLLARGVDPLGACLWGVWLHGEAGRRLAQTTGPIGFLAREIPGLVPGLLAGR